MQIAVLGRILLVLLIILGALAIAGAVYLIGMKKRKAAAAPLADADDPFSEKTVENVSTLNDRFNRARYMDQDGN